MNTNILVRPPEGIWSGPQIDNTVK